MGIKSSPELARERNDTKALTNGIDGISQRGVSLGTEDEPTLVTKSGRQPLVRTRSSLRTSRMRNRASNDSRRGVANTGAPKPPSTSIATKEGADHSGRNMGLPKTNSKGFIILDSKLHHISSQRSTGTEGTVDEEHGVLDEDGIVMREKKIEIFVIEGKNLPKTGVFGCNAYVSLIYCDHVFNTRPIKGKRDPVWHHLFSIDDMDKKLIEGSVMDWNRTSKHEKLGSFTIRVSDVMDRQEAVTSYELLGTDGAPLTTGGKVATISINVRKHESTHNVKLPPYSSSLAEYVHQIDIDTNESVAGFPIQFAHQRGFQMPPPLSKILEAGEGRGELNEIKAAETARRAKISKSDEDADEVEAKNIFLYMTWRERLSARLGSLQANIFIIMLVAFDLTAILVFEFAIDDTNKDCFNRMSLAEMLLSFFVLSVFSVEITLRMTAHGIRFFNGIWNWFDLIVVGLSLGLLIWKLHSDINSLATTFCPKVLGRTCKWPDLVLRGEELPAELGGGNACEKLELLGFEGDNGLAEDMAKSTKVSRAISRVAVGLRFVRAFMGMNRARVLHGDVLGKLREKVGGRKRRYMRDGFNLDLTYITNRMIAMSTPGFGAHKGYRNDIADVARFLTLKHYGMYRVFNLCEEHEGNYHPTLLFNQMRRVAFDDHNPPTIKQILVLCNNAMDYMLLDPRNCIALHCKGGKGRTGVMCVAWLLVSGHRSTAQDALELFAYRRTRKYVMGDPHNQTVEGPSQIRYCHYFEAQLYHGIDCASEPAMIVHAVCFPAAPGKPRSSNYISLLILCNGVAVYDSKRVGSLPYVKAGASFGWILPPTIVRGDVKFEVYKHAGSKGTSKMVGKRKYEKERKEVWPLCQVCIHTAFHTQERCMVFDKWRVDYSHKDRRHKEFVRDFGMSLHFADLDPSRNKTVKRLKLNVIQGMNLLSSDINGLSDPYVRFNISDNAWAQTKTIFRSLNPIWNEELEMPIADLPVELKIDVIDHDTIGDDEIIGIATLLVDAKMLGLWRKEVKSKVVEVPLSQPGTTNVAGGKLVIELSVVETILPKEYWEIEDFKELCKAKGEEMFFREGQEIIPFAFNQQCLYFVVKGMVQVMSKRISSSQNVEEPEISNLLGQGAIFAVPSFLLSLPSMQHVAYTDCELRMISPPPTPIQGEFNTAELTLFYKVLARLLSETYLTLKEETRRIAFRTVQSDNDDSLVIEQLQHDMCELAIKKFKLPVIEKCTFLAQMVEVEFRDETFMSRLMLMSSCIIIEPTLFGRDYLEATDEEVIDNRRILKVEMLLPDGEGLTRAQMLENEGSCLTLEVTVQDPLSAFDGVTLALGRHTVMSLILKFPNKSIFQKSKDILQGIAWEWSQMRMVNNALSGSKFNCREPFLEKVLDEAVDRGCMHFFKPNCSITGSIGITQAGINAMYFICRGKAKAVTSSDSIPKVAMIVHPGEIFGETEFTGIKNQLSLVAGSSGCEVIVLQGDFLLSKCDQDPSFARQLYHILSLGLAEKINEELVVRYGESWCE